MNTLSFDEALRDAMQAVENRKTECEEHEEEIDRIADAYNTILDEL